jgi:FMN phosphatase YigB (HAD superfamily)
MRNGKDKIILTDCDNVLLDWLQGFNNFMNDMGYQNASPSSYTMHEHFGVTEQELQDYIKAFNEGHEHFGSLPPCEGSLEAIETLSNSGYRFVVISSCSNEENVVNLRIKNLIETFGDVFVDVHCIGLRDCKKQHLSQYDSTFWIEDHIGNAIKGLELGHDSILIGRTWNTDIKNNDVKRFDKWSDIVEYIQSKDDGV